MQASKPAEKLNANNLLLILLLISFIIIGTTTLVAKTLISGLIRDTKVLSAENKANSNLNKDLKAAPDLIASYQKLGLTAVRLADALPNNSNFPALIVALENMASDSNVGLKSVSPAQVAVVQTNTTGTVTTAGGDGIKPVAIEVAKPLPYAYTVAFDGNYAALQHFLADLEIYDRPMRVTSLKLSGSGSALSGTLDIQTYYQNEAKLPLGKDIIK
jgi:Tfp pilus assembly protein PilO